MAFMEAGACVYENSSPVTEKRISPTVSTMYCGRSHRMCTEFSGVSVNERSSGWGKKQFHYTMREIGCFWGGKFSISRRLRWR